MPYLKTLSKRAGEPLRPSGDIEVEPVATVAEGSDEEFFTPDYGEAEEVLPSAGATAKPTKDPTKKPLFHGVFDVLDRSLKDGDARKALYTKVAADTGHEFVKGVRRLSEDEGGGLIEDLTLAAAAFPAMRPLAALAKSAFDPVRTNDIRDYMIRGESGDEATTTRLRDAKVSDEVKAELEKSGRQALAVRGARDIVTDSVMDHLRSAYVSEADSPDAGKARFDAQMERWRALKEKSTGEKVTTREMEHEIASMVDQRLGGVDSDEGPLMSIARSSVKDTGNLVNATLVRNMASAQPLLSGDDETDRIDPNRWLESEEGLETVLPETTAERTERLVDEVGLLAPQVLEDQIRQGNLDYTLVPNFSDMTTKAVAETGAAPTTKNSVAVTAGDAQALATPMIQEMLHKEEGFRGTVYDDLNPKTNNGPIGAYDDALGTPTIGYGHAISADERDRFEKYLSGGEVMSKEDAVALFLEDVEEHQTWLPKIKKPVTPEMITALTSLAFNAGPNHPDVGKVINAINEGDYQKASETLRDGVATSKGKFHQGLKDRRGREADLFLSGGLPAEPVEGEVTEVEAVGIDSDIIDLGSDDAEINKFEETTGTKMTEVEGGFFAAMKDLDDYGLKPATGSQSWMRATKALRVIQENSPETYAKLKGYGDLPPGQGFYALERELQRDFQNELASRRRGGEEIDPVKARAQLRARTAEVIASARTEGLWATPSLVSRNYLMGIDEVPEEPGLIEAAVTPLIEIVGAVDDEIIYRQESAAMVTLNALDAAPILGQSYNLGMLENYVAPAAMEFYEDPSVAAAASLGLKTSALFGSLSVVGQIALRASGEMTEMHAAGVRGVTERSNLVEFGMDMSSRFGEWAVTSDAGEAVLTAAVKRDLVPFIPDGLTAVDERQRVLAATDVVRAGYKLAGVPIGFAGAVAHPDLLLPLSSTLGALPDAIKAYRGLSRIEKAVEALGRTKLSEINAVGLERMAATLNTLASLSEAARVDEAGEVNAEALGQLLRAMDDSDAGLARGDDLDAALREVSPHPMKTIDRASEEFVGTLAQNGNYGAKAAIDPQLSSTVFLVAEDVIASAKASGDPEKVRLANEAAAAMDRLGLGQALTLTPKTADLRVKDAVSADKAFNTRDRVLVLRRTLQLLDDVEDGRGMRERVFQGRLLAPIESIGNTKVTDIEGMPRGMTTRAAVDVLGPVSDEAFEAGLKTSRMGDAAKAEAREKLKTLREWHSDFTKAVDDNTILDKDVNKALRQRFEDLGIASMTGRFFEGQSTGSRYRQVVKSIRGDVSAVSGASPMRAKVAQGLAGVLTYNYSRGRAMQEFARAMVDEDALKLAGLSVDAFLDPNGGAHRLRRFAAAVQVGGRETVMNFLGGLPGGSKVSGDLSRSAVSQNSARAAATQMLADGQDEWSTATAIQNAVARKLRARSAALKDGGDEARALEVWEQAQEVAKPEWQETLVQWMHRSSDEYNRARAAGETPNLDEFELPVGIDPSILRTGDAEARPTAAVKAWVDDVYNPAYGKLPPKEAADPALTPTAKQGKRTTRPALSAEDKKGVTAILDNMVRYMAGVTSDMSKRQVEAVVGSWLDDNIKNVRRVGGEAQYRKQFDALRGEFETMVEDRVRELVGDGPVTDAARRTAQLDALDSILPVMTEAEAIILTGAHKDFIWDSIHSARFGDEFEARRLFQGAESAGASGDEAAEAARLYEEMGTESPYFKRWSGGLRVIGGDEEIPSDGRGVYRTFHGSPVATRIEQVDMARSDDGRTFFSARDPRVAEVYAGSSRVVAPGPLVFSPSEQTLSAVADLVVDGDLSVPGKYQLKSGSGGGLPRFAEDVEVAVYSGGVDISSFMAPTVSLPKGASAEDVLSAARTMAAKSIESFDERSGAMPGILPLFVRLERPLVYDAAGKNYDELPVPGDPNRLTNTRRLANFARDEGYDGLIIRSVTDGTDVVDDVVVVFDPTQVKSVFNRGTFDSGDARILFQGDDQSRLAQVDWDDLPPEVSDDAATAYGESLPRVTLSRLAEGDASQAAREVAGAVPEGGPLSTVLRGLSDNKALRDVPVATFDESGRVLGEVDQDIVRHIERSGGASVYFEPSETYPRGALFFPTFDEFARTPGVIAHELIHAATVSTMVDALAVDARTAGKVTDDAIAGTERMLETFSAVKRYLSERGKDVYGMTNLYEFVAEALTNAEFQKSLSGISFHGNRSIWSEFVDAMRLILGLEAEGGRISALDVVLEDYELIVHDQYRAKPRMVASGAPVAHEARVLFQAAENPYAEAPRKAAAANKRLAKARQQSEPLYQKYEQLKVRKAELDKKVEELQSERASVAPSRPALSISADLGNAVEERRTVVREISDMRGYPGSSSPLNDVDEAVDDAFQRAQPVTKEHAQKITQAYEDAQKALDEAYEERAGVAKQIQAWRAEQQRLHEAGQRSDAAEIQRRISAAQDQSMRATHKVEDKHTAAKLKADQLRDRPVVKAYGDVIEDVVEDATPAAKIEEKITEAFRDERNLEAPASIKDVEVGEPVMVTSADGTMLLEEPAVVKSVDEKLGYVLVEGTDTGFPVEQTRILRGDVADAVKKSDTPHVWPDQVDGGVLEGMARVARQRREVEGLPVSKIPAQKMPRDPAALPADTHRWPGEERDALDATVDAARLRADVSGLPEAAEITGTQAATKVERLIGKSKDDERQYFYDLIEWLSEKADRGAGVNIGDFRRMAPEGMTDDEVKKVYKTFMDEKIIVPGKKKGRRDVSPEEVAKAQTFIDALVYDLSEEGIIESLDVAGRVSRLDLDSLTRPETIKDAAVRDVVEKLKKYAPQELDDMVEARAPTFTAEVKKLEKELRRVEQFQKEAVKSLKGLKDKRKRTLRQGTVNRYEQEKLRLRDALDRLKARRDADAEAHANLGKLSAEARARKATADGAGDVGGPPPAAAGDAPLEGSNSNAKGMAYFLSDGSALLYAFKNADASTGLHEMAHVMRRNLRQTHLETTLGWANDFLETEGLSPVRLNAQGNFEGEVRSVINAEELFAEGFERYLREGVAPTSALEKVFSVIRGLMAKIHSAITDEAINVEISDEMYNVFDEIFGAQRKLKLENLPEVQRYLDFQRASEGGEMRRGGRIVEQAPIEETAVDHMRQTFRSLDDYRARFGMPYGDPKTDLTQGPGAETLRSKPLGPVSRRALSLGEVSERMGKDPSQWSAKERALAAADKAAIGVASGVQAVAFGLFFGGDAERAYRALPVAARSHLRGPMRELEEMLADLSMLTVDSSRLTGDQRERAVSNIVKFFRGASVQMQTGAQRGRRTKSAFVDSEQHLIRLFTRVFDAIDDESLKALDVDAEAVLAKIAGADRVPGHSSSGALSGLWQGYRVSRPEVSSRTSEAFAGGLVISDDTRARLQVVEGSTESVPELFDDTLGNIFKALTGQNLGKGGLVPEEAQKVAALMVFHAGGTQIRKGGEVFTAADLRSGAYGLDAIYNGSVVTKNGVTVEIPGLLKAGVSPDKAMPAFLMMGVSGYTHGLYQDMRVLGMGLNAGDAKAYMRYVAGNAAVMTTAEVDRAKAVAKNYGLNARFTVSPDSVGDFYIPEAARDELAARMQHGMRQVGAEGQDKPLMQMLGAVYGYQLQNLIYGTVGSRQSFKLMSTQDLGIQLGIYAGGAAGAAAATRVGALTVLSAGLPGSAGLVSLERAADIADLGKRVYDHALNKGGPIVEAAAFKASFRAWAAKNADEATAAATEFLSRAKHRVEVAPILENQDHMLAIGGRVYNAQNLRRVFTRAGLYSNSFKEMKSLFRENFSNTGDRNKLSESVGLSGANRQFLDSADEVAQGFFASGDAKRVGRRMGSSVFEHGVESADAWADLERTGAAVTLMEMGYDPEAASRVVVEAIYDYRGSMTDGDRHWLRRILMPFWAFRKNANTQAANLVATPRGAYMATALMRATRYGAEAATHAVYETILGPYGVNVTAMEPATLDAYYDTRLFLEFGEPEPTPEILEAYRASLPEEDKNISDEALLEYDFEGWTIKEGYGGYSKVPEHAKRALRGLLASKYSVDGGGRYKGLRSTMASSEAMAEFAKLGAEMAVRDEASRSALPGWVRLRPTVQVPVPVLTEDLEVSLRRGMGDSLYFMMPDNFMMSAIDHASATFATMYLGGQIALEGAREIAGDPQANVTKADGYRMLNAFAPIVDVRDYGSPFSKLLFSAVEYGTMERAPRVRLDPRIARLIEGSSGFELEHEGERVNSPGTAFAYKTFAGAASVTGSLFAGVEVDESARRAFARPVKVEVIDGKRTIVPYEGVGYDGTASEFTDDSRTVGYTPYLSGMGALYFEYTPLGQVNKFMLKHRDTTLEQAMSTDPELRNAVLELLGESARVSGIGVLPADRARAAKMGKPYINLK